MAGRILVSTRKGLFEYARGAQGWTVEAVHFLGDNVTLALHDPRDGRQYAALDHGHFGIKLHRRESGGEWVEVAVPEYPQKPEEVSDANPMTQRERSWKLDLIWALEPAGVDRPGGLWCGTIPGGLFRSDDAGESWALVESLWNDERRKEWFGGGKDEPGIHSICVDPRDSAHVLVAISCGGVWRTRDEGASWELCARGMRAEYLPPDQAGDENTQDPHHMVACPAQPDRLWVQHHNGIFRSVDGAESWSEVRGAGPSEFGFGVVVHPRNPDTAWFVPAVKDEKRHACAGQLVVTRTRDGGESFEELRAGLPQEHAYDLVYRHALAIDASGERLAFGSTTGGLWVSEDGGESWHELSSHLPPVYAVQIAEED